MIPRNVRDQIFPPLPSVSAEIIALSREHLSRFKLSKVLAPAHYVPAFPGLAGPNINDHFQRLAYNQTDGYSTMASAMATARIPQVPKRWKLASGWTRYASDGSFESIEVPLSNAAYPKRRVYFLTYRMH